MGANRDVWDVHTQHNSIHNSKIHLLSEYITDLFRVAVDGMEEKWEAETENGSGKECRENSNLLPADLDPRIDKETDSENNESYET